MSAFVVSRSDDCEATNYRTVGLDEGIEIDQLGVINMDTTRAVPETNVQVYATIGGK